MDTVAILCPMVQITHISYLFVGSSVDLQLTESATMDTMPSSIACCHNF